MTNLEAIQAEIEPFTLSRVALTKALTDVGLVAIAEYNDAKLVARATVKALSRLTVLAKESEGKFSQDYTAGEVEKRIVLICNEFGFTVSEFVISSSISDGSNSW